MNGNELSFVCMSFAIFATHASAKDLLAVKGTPTTWGAGLYQNQMFDYNATVVNRLDEAGAILIAKLTLGSLAQGDRWWKERTRNPWNVETGAPLVVLKTDGDPVEYGEPLIELVGLSGGERGVQQGLDRQPG